MKSCHIVTGRKLRGALVRCLLSIYCMPGTVFDAEKLMIDTRASASRELAVVWRRQRRKHGEAALISSVS